ncbi:MAG: phosphotransferase [Hyphomicrobiales bacterium]
MTSTQRIKDLDIWPGEVEIAPLTGGLSNEGFIVTSGDEKCVVRFGEDIPVHHVFRDNELMASHAAAEAGFAPEIVYAEPGMMVVRFVEGHTYGEEDVRGNIAGIADLTRRFHTEMPRYVSGPGRMFHVFHVVRDYARTLKAGDSRMVPELPRLMTLADELEAVQPNMPIIYAHGDLLPANFIDDGDKVWLIDYEYAAYATAMFDLAGIASNAQMSPDQDMELLEAYFGEKPDGTLARAHAAMKCASLLREAMWSMVSELHLDAPGVDYVAYTIENLERLESALQTYRSEY